MHWYDMACAEIEEDYSKGFISQSEYDKAMRELHEELEEDVTQQNVYNHY